MPGVAPAPRPMSGTSEELDAAIVAAEKAGASLIDLEGPLDRLDQLREAERAARARVALQDVDYAIGQGDAGAAELALEEAAAEGAGQEALEAAEAALGELRMRLDPEGEARRRRLEARKAWLRAWRACCGRVRRNQ